MASEPDNYPTGVEIVLDGLVFPEGPRWHDGSLWIADQHAHTVWRLDPAGTSKIVAEFEDMPSGLGFLPDGTLVVAMMRTQRLLRVDRRGACEVHADFSALGQGWLNDIVVDGRGRAYVGRNHGKHARFADEPDEVLSVELDGSYRVVVQEIWGPNGTVVSPDNRTLIIAAARSRTLEAFDVEADGALTNRRIWASDVRASGICLDADDAVWVSTVTGREFRRLKEGGQILDRIPVDGWAVACVLGGDDRRTLFVAVADATMALFDELVEPGNDHLSPARGRIEKMTVSTPGVGWP